MHMKDINSIIACQHIYPSIHANPNFTTRFWLLFLNNLFSLPCVLWRHLTQRPCLFYYKGESNHVSAENERLIFTLSSVVDVVELNQRLPPSIYLSSPSTNTQVVIALLCYTVVVSISALASLSVRFHISTQFSVSNSKRDFKRILI